MLNLYKLILSSSHRLIDLIKRNALAFVAILFIQISIPNTSIAQTDSLISDIKLVDMNLDELLKIKVTSVNRYNKETSFCPSKPLLPVISIFMKVKSLKLKA